jgi:hypothetical protein
MRPNSANDDCTSTDTCSSWLIGISSRLCSVVNATSVPAESALPPWPCRPATRYTSAGLTPKNACVTAKNERPTIAWRTCRRAWLAFSTRYRSVSWAWRPNTFASRIPDTDNVSCVIEPIVASDACASRRATRRDRPTRRLKITNTGATASEITVSSGDSSSIATTEEMSVTMLDSTEEAVEVIVVWTPPTSLSSRDCTSPEREEV